jgi:glycosyltransferase involved in cell wall biosynthesis
MSAQSQTLQFEPKTFGKSVSFVIPVKDERESIEALCHQIESVMNTLSGFCFEIVIVDDGSRDGTTQIIEALTRKSSRITGIILRRNFGKSAALMAAFEQVSSDIVITMDGDLQDDPAEIPNLLKKLDEGYDMVSGWKKSRQDPTEKRMASKMFNGVVSRLTKVDIHDFNCGFKAYRLWTVKSLKLFGNQYRFIPALLAWMGARVTEVAVTHHKRQFGKSKYGLTRYFHGLFDLFTVLLLTRFSAHPLYFFGIVAVPFVGLGVLSGSYLLGSHVLFHLTGSIGENLNSRPLLIISFSLVLIGIQIFLIGLLAELITRVSQNVERFSIRNTFRHPSQNAPTVTPTSGKGL